MQTNSNNAMFRHVTKQGVYESNQRNFQISKRKSKNPVDSDIVAYVQQY